MTSSPVPQKADGKSKALLRTAALLLDRPAGAAPAGESEIVLVRGSGATVTDADGTAYLDFDGGGGTLLLGHADERLVVAVDKAVARGFRLPAMSEAEIRFAELLVGRCPSVDALSFHADEAAAFRFAVHAAKAHTRHKRFLRLVDDGSLGWLGNGQLDDSDCVDDVPAALEFVRRHAKSVAAVLIEPVSVAHGLAHRDAASLMELQGLCSQHKVLTILDESLTALRAGVGGFAARIGLRPDMIVFGSSLSGGLPFAVVGGRREIMQNSGVARRQVPAAPNLLACAAAGVVLQAAAEPDVLKDLADLGSQFETALQALMVEFAAPLQVSRLDSMLHLRVIAPGAADADRLTAFHRLYRGLLARGVLWPHHPMAPAFLSTAHTADHLAQLIEALRACFAEEALFS